MTRAHRGILTIAGVVAALMLLFPPWETLGGTYLGHSPFTSPPIEEDALPDTQRWALPEPDPIARVSWKILGIQSLVLLGCVGAAFLVLPPRRR
jgi:hypothetical protein